MVYQCRGELWLLDNLAPDSEPRPLGVSLGSASTALAPRLISAADHLGDLSCDYTGQGSVIEVRGTIHWLTHRDGPARALAVEPDVRARMPRVLGRDGQVVWVSDAGGADGLEVAPADGPEVPAGAAERTRLRAASAGSPRGSWGWSASWPPPPTGPRPRWPPGTGGCWWWTSPPGRCGSWPSPRTVPCPGWPTPRTRPGWPGRIRARSRSPGSGSPGWAATRSWT